MTRLIDADTPIHVQIYNDMTEEWRLKETTVAKALDDWADGCPPTVDAAPVVHAQWITKGDPVFADKYYCSNCGEQANVDLYGDWILSNYCPICGADMRGEKDEK